MTRPFNPSTWGGRRVRDNAPYRWRLGQPSASETWDDERVVVVRHDVVVPSGKTLTLGADAIVKFTEGARIVVEDGGAVVAEGA